MEADQALQPGVQYMVRAYQPGGPNVVSTFPFDLDGPPTPPTSPGPGDDTLLLLPESAEPLHQASPDLDGDGTPELVTLTGGGGGVNQLGYDFLQMFVIAAAGDGETYDQETHESASVGYVRETVAEAGLSFEVPAA